MRSTFGGLNTATRALAAQQVAIETTSHNIANANTPGFSRQDAVLETTDPFTVPAFNRTPHAGQLGTGVEVAMIRRMRDSFLDAQVRQQTAGLGEQQMLRDVMGQIEVVFNEPSDSGLNAMMTRFFNAWQAVANRPEDRAVRTALVEEARSLALTFRQTDQQLEQLRFDINRQLEIKTTQVNDLAQQVATLNAQIGQVEGSGQQANDLRDQRDQLVNRLASLTRVSQSENTNGVINLYVSGRALVLGDVASPMTAALTGGGDVSVQWQSDGATVSLGSGELAGLARVRDTTLAQQRTGLNSLVTTLITEVNALHTTGYGLTDASAPNRAFFTGTNATTIAVNGTIETTPELLAVAGAPNLPGDNSIGLAIAKLRDGLTMGGGTATFQAYYRSQTATLGTAARQAVTTAQNQQVLVDMLNRRQESFSGVNIDEETTNLIKFQHAYQAAARVITTVDDMLDRVINRMGRVGL